MIRISYVLKMYKKKQFSRTALCNQVEETIQVAEKKSAVKLKLLTSTGLDFNLT